MMRTMLKSKIHRATVTQADLHYVGSVTVDEDLLDAADLLPGEQVAIFGDYDVDGATSAALMVLILRDLGLSPRAYIPDRIEEGYGPSGPAHSLGQSHRIKPEMGADIGDRIPWPHLGHQAAPHVRLVFVDHVARERRHPHRIGAVD